MQSTSCPTQSCGLHHRFCHPFLPLEAAIWCTLYVIWYCIICFFLHMSYMLHTFPSLLLCFLCWLCCQLQILRPHLLPIVSNKWICICSRKHLAGFRQRQLLLSTSCLFLPFLAPFRIISIISCTNQWLPFCFFQTILRWNLFQTHGWHLSHFFPGTRSSARLHPISHILTPSGACSHDTCEAWWRCSAASRLSVSFLVISTGFTSEAYFA